MENEQMKTQRIFKKQVLNKICVNAGIDWKNKKLNGCGGEKRNGSKYCQKCSDEHNSK